MKWKSKPDIYGRKGRTVHSRPGVMASDYKCDNAVTIEEGRHFNGSGPKAFGGASEWPHLKIDISFRVGEEAHRTELVNKIKALIDTHYQR